MKIVIIGGGVAGLSIGWRLLAHAECEVVVLERAQPGRAATWASGGMIAAAAEGFDGAETPEALLARHSASLWPHFAAEIEEQSQQAIGYRRDGTLIAAVSPDTLKALAARASSDASLLSADEALRLEPMLRNDLQGALWAPADAQVDNRALGTALGRAFVAGGGFLSVNEAAVRLEIANGRMLGVRTPFALHGGDVFVIAAGAWSGEIEGLPPDAVPPIVPVKGEMITLEAPQAGAMPAHLVWGNDIYLIPRHNRLLVGATASRSGFDTSLTNAARNRLFNDAAQLMPALKDWSIVEHWAGLRPCSPDDLPLIGETVIPGLFVASGQYRNGILFAPAIAEAMHDLIVERRTLPGIEAFDPKRFAGHSPR